MLFNDLDLHPSILKALSACGYAKPTPVQAKSIPIILEGKDLVASAQTGTGKTAAFVLPALNHLASQPAVKKPRILVLTPTRELATQITKAAHMYGKFLRFNIISLVGGMSYEPQIRDLKRGADIIVATPGRLMDHMEQKRVDLSAIDMLILDEADRMLDMGFIEDVEYIAKLTPGKRQTLLFSATMDNKLMSVVRHLMKHPVRIDLSNEKIASPQVKQELYRAQNMRQKTRLLKHFLNDTNIYKAIIFSATKMNADNLAEELRSEGFPAAALHGDLRQNVRHRTLEQLRSGRIQFLVATDVAARGIDVSDITHVINYDLPKFCEDYVHRIGRTGRAGKTGVAISFVTPTDAQLLKRIERYTGQRLQVNTLEESKIGVNEPRVFAVREEEPKRHHQQRGGKEKHHKRPSFSKSFSNDRAPRHERKSSEKRSHADASHGSARSFVKEGSVFERPRYDFEETHQHGERKKPTIRYANDVRRQADQRPTRKSRNEKPAGSANRKSFKQRHQRPQSV